MTVKIIIDIIFLFLAQDMSIFVVSMFTLLLLLTVNLFNNTKRRTIGEASQKPITVSAMKLVKFDITLDSIIPINHIPPTANLVLCQEKVQIKFG